MLNDAKVKLTQHFSPFWLLPILAMIVIGWLFWQNHLNHGSAITISFQSADGIVPGRTPIRYQGVDVGTVESISLSENYRTIKIKASIKSDMSDALRTDTQFWLVTPQASLAGVSGLDALVGGNYIGMLPGTGKPASEFIAKDSQPHQRKTRTGLLIHLHAPDLGSLNTGSQVYYQKIPVGKVDDYSLASGGGINIDVVIDRRYRHLVKKTSRFWNISGIKGDLNLSGIHVEMTNLSALINGAIAFDSPVDSQPATNDASYNLYPNLAESQHGVKIQVSFNSGDNLRAGQTPLLYQGLQVGTLSKLALTNNKTVSGEILIDPSVTDLMRENTRIEMNQPQFNSGSLTNLLTGSTLTLYPGSGAVKKSFSVKPASESLMNVPGSLTLQLKAAESYGIMPNQPLILNGIPVGKVATRELTPEGVLFQVSIAPEYRHFIHSNSRFVADSQLQVKLGLDGFEMTGASPQEWLQGGIRVHAGNKGQPLSSYPLFANEAAAAEGKSEQNSATTLKLVANSLPDIQAGSVVLYRRYQVGEIVKVTPHTDNFVVEVHINPQYRDLVTKKSVFWAEGGAKVKLDSAGLTVQATPLNRALKGAISFDNVQGFIPATGQYRQLYTNETSARAVGSQITLKTFDGSKISPGMPIRYLGLNVGQIESLALSQDNRQVEVKAVLYPEYVSQFARVGSTFSVVSPVISATGVNHLESLLQPYINVDPGKGSAKRWFQLQESTITDSRYLDGLNFYVDTPEAGSLALGTPLLYRGIEVGIVTGTSLGPLADRVQVAIKISRNYQHLVRNNSVFWLASGYSVNLGLTGGMVKTGTFQQFIRGGIQFATPPTVPLAPAAQSNQHFLLREEPPKAWQQWGTALPQDAQ